MNFTASIMAQHEEKMRNLKKMEEANAEAGIKLRSFMRVADYRADSRSRVTRLT